MPRQYHKNPRTITNEQLERLEDTLERLGDLSGIVHDLNTDEIIGGNQRSKVFRLEDCEIVLTEEYAQPDEQGTVGLGFVVWKGKRYAYRAVRWDARTAEEANIVANRAGGDWDFEILAQEFAMPDLLAWGFEPADFGMDETPAPADPLDGLIPDGDRYSEQYGVIVMCESEAHQESVYNKLLGEGYSVKVVVT